VFIHHLTKVLTSAPTNHQHPSPITHHHPSPITHHPDGEVFGEMPDEVFGEHLTIQNPHCQSFFRHFGEVLSI